MPAIPAVIWEEKKAPAGQEGANSGANRKALAYLGFRECRELDAAELPARRISTNTIDGAERRQTD